MLPEHRSARPALKHRCLAAWTRQPPEAKPGRPALTCLGWLPGQSRWSRFRDACCGCSREAWAPGLCRRELLLARRAHPRPVQARSSSGAFRGRPQPHEQPMFAARQGPARIKCSAHRGRPGTARFFLRQQAAGDLANQPSRLSYVGDGAVSNASTGAVGGCSRDRASAGLCPMRRLRPVVSPQAGGRFPDAAGD
jgi:hypothetical protein